MKKIDLGQAISIFANVGVIAGIVFLGIELRQNNELSRAEAQRARAAIVSENFRSVTENPEIASVLLRDSQGESLTDLELFQARSFWLSTLTTAELIYAQSIPSELPRTVQRLRRFSSTYPEYRKVWSEREGEFDEAFVAWMNENVINSR